ncbi:irk-2 [Cordylochernes scorpioides]|uniref:Irk-2 n=1 Tax=Cordylochernes scorpioides TaxID=51811 RepID=A0ABY6LB14_9ARAC|nr:irk-2 [Cordylochernes scorpioides]
MSVCTGMQLDETREVWQELIPGAQKTYERSSSTPADAKKRPTPPSPPSPGPGYKYAQVVSTPKPSRNRMVLRSGAVNLAKKKVSRRSQRYLQDIFTTLVDIQWRYNLLVFALGFFLSWTFYALIWWIICYTHKDFEHLNDDNWTPCVQEVDSFTTAFLFSVETQHTIGYGSRATTGECPEAIIIMSLQSVTGVMIQCFMAGIVFAKLSRPAKRSQTLMFSRYAAISFRDGRLCLMFRIGDVRKSHIIGAHVSAVLIRRRITAEGEVKRWMRQILPYYQRKLEVTCDDVGDSVFLLWPSTVVHIIDSRSPLYNMSAEDMVREKYEILVLLEGTIESTGSSFQARTSYLPADVLWGHRFEQVVSFQRETGEHVIDYSKFDRTVEVETVQCSAREFQEYQRVVRQLSQSPTFSLNSGANLAGDLLRISSEPSHLLQLDADFPSDVSPKNSDNPSA